MSDEVRRQALIKELRRQDLIAKLNAQDRGEEPEEEMSGWDVAKDLGTRGLDAASRALDYAGGAVRTAGTGAIDLVSGGNTDLYHEGDWERASVGKAPTGSEILERTGAEPGFKTGAAGLALDIGTDPLTYLTFGASAASKLSRAGKSVGEAALVVRLAKAMKLDKAIRPLEKVTEKAGKAIYKSAKTLAESDQKLAEFGKKPLSDILLDNKVWGRASTIEKKTEKLADEAIKKRNEILDAAQEAGAALDRNTTYKHASDKLLKMTQSESVDTREAARLLRERLKEVASAMPENGFSVKGAQELKTDIYRGLGGKAYKEGRPITGAEGYIQGEKALARGVKEAQEQAVEKSIGRGDELKHLNEEYGQLVTPRDMLEKNVRQQMRASPVTTVDAMASWYSPGLLAMKKLGDISKTNVGRTGAGLAIHEFGAPASAVLGQRYLINDQKRKSPWDLLGKKEDEK
jgi:hypothetical protein